VDFSLSLSLFFSFHFILFFYHHCWTISSREIIEKEKKREGRKEGMNETTNKQKSKKTTVQCLW